MFRIEQQKVLRWTSILVVTAVPAFAGEAWGSWAQTGKLTADDAAGGDYFGRSVALWGDIAVIGADYAAPGGAAYVFDITTGVQLHKLAVADGAMYDHFGAAVGVSDGIVVIGAWGDDDAGDHAGSAYLFDVITGEQLHQLMPDDEYSGSKFGYAVEINGGVAIVGAPYAHCLFSGAAYLFDVASGQQLAKLTASNYSSHDHFGSSVAISGDLALVGADSDNDLGGNSGSAYVFDVSDPQKPVEIHKLLAADGAPADFFGYRVALSGPIAIVGAYGKDDVGEESGSAYLFNACSGEQLHKLVAGDAAAGDEFGRAVAVRGTPEEAIAIVGAPYDGDVADECGSLYIFDAASGQQLKKLIASDAAMDDLYGWSAAIHGDTILVGAHSKNGYESNSGAAYVIEACGADVTGDGVIDTLDLLAIIDAWGTADPDADINGDGIVDVLDLLAVLAGWGPCE